MLWKCVNGHLQGGYVFGVGDGFGDTPAPHSVNWANPHGLGRGSMSGAANTSKPRNDEEKP